ncbi:fibrinogen-like protein A [Anopheles ziemanni]|uniref:fibrinogen-like protein A n=1 Tax=Anopheles coustani TaxID=139045 RepID=UPI00265A7179|nr:fibrinogen-like protein A [Anopheles coustani]XP_058170519.1 fibrinogen-like protein A [Anopheles ziemanni]
MAKLDYLQYKLHEMELGQKERDEEFAEKFTKLEGTIENIQWAIIRHDQDAGHNLTALQAHSRKILAQQTACANHEKMRNEISQLTQKLNHSIGSYSMLSSLASSFNGTIKSCNESPANESGLYWIQVSDNSIFSSVPSRLRESFKSCKEAPANVSGVYWIQLSGNSFTFEGFCEQNSFGGGWLVIQYRYDGSLDFYRNWTEYQQGFGNINKEFWIGLERLYQLTSQGRYELLVELKAFNGSYRYAQYDEFQIWSESEQYPLKKLGTYSGTAEDAMIRQKGMKFSTKDRDNDASSTNCAVERGGAWWYESCTDSNLNGKYMNQDNSYSMFWSEGFTNTQGWAYSRMMIRKI